MITESKTTENYEVQAALSIGKTEFDAARGNAYLNHTDRYPVMGIAPGLAKLPDLEKTYGPAVLFDEALEIVIPECFGTFLKENDVRIFGRPKVENVTFLPDGGVRFQIKANMFPKVTLGTYKGIAVPYARAGQQIEFEQAVVQKACEAMQGEIPPQMIAEKVKSMLAQEKLSVNQDTVYHLLADMLVILERSYHAAGVHRPKVQVRREALDLMLQTASAEHEMDWQEFMKEQLLVMTERYHSVPDRFDETIRQIIQKRAEEKGKMTPEERTDEVFLAYLGSLELSEEQWKNQRSAQAAKEVCADLLFDAVARQEKIQITDEEVRHFIETLADQYGISVQEAEEHIDRDALTEKLKWEKAKRLILDSAVTDETAKQELDQKKKALREKMKKDAEITTA